MSIPMSPSDLHALGLQVDPDDPTQVIHVAHQVESSPDESWDLDQLGRYAEIGLSEADRLQRESIQLGRRSTVQIFRVGRALSIARQKVPWGEWERWLTTHNIKKTSAWEAIELYERAGSEEAIANLTPSEAKRRYGIAKSTRRDTQDATRPLDPSSDFTSQSEDELDDAEPDDADPSDKQDDEPDLPARPPRNLKDMLVASSNLLLSCLQRSDELDAACGDILAEIDVSVQQLRAKVVS